MIPNNIAEVEIPPEDITRMIYTKTLAKREKIMFELSDGFIALPRGIGTLEEVFTVMAWNALQYHDRPIGLLNAGGYYNKLVELLHFQRDEGFIPQVWVDQLVISDDIEFLVKDILNQVYRSEWCPGPESKCTFHRVFIILLDNSKCFR